MEKPMTGTDFLKMVMDEIPHMSDACLAAIGKAMADIDDGKLDPRTLAEKLDYWFPDCPDGLLPGWSDK